MASFFKTQIDFGRVKSRQWMDRFQLCENRNYIVSDTKRLELRCRAPLIILFRIFLVIMRPPKKQKKNAEVKRDHLVSRKKRTVTH